MKDLAIVTCHFNWHGFSNPKRNLHRFLRQNAHLPVYGIELSLTTEFETSGMPNWTQIQVGYQNVCFQKEALINKLVKEIVPSSFTKIAWIDADVFFTNRDWYKEASIALDYVKVIQLFDTAVWTNRQGREFERFPALAVNGPIENAWTGHPGFALAANRELWDHGGLFAKAPVGNGDTVFLYTLFKKKLPSVTKDGIFFSSLDSEYDSPEYLAWQESINNYVNGSIGYISGECIHEWHGDKHNRKYGERKKFLEGKTEKDIFINNQGILEFRASFGMDAMQGILNYFKERQEDGQQ